MQKSSQKTFDSASKIYLIQTMAAVRQEILTAARSLSPEARRIIYLGSWSVREMLAHLIGWDHANQQAIQELLAGKLPAFYAFHDRGWKSYNQMLVERFDQAEDQVLLVEIARSHTELLSALEVLPVEEYDRDRNVRFKGWKVTIRRLMQAELQDEEEHLAQLIEFMEHNKQNKT